MAKRRNRAAWVLAGVLAVMLGGGGWLFPLYQSHLPGPDRLFTLLPEHERGFGTFRAYRAPSRGRNDYSVLIKLGFFTVRAK